MEPDGTPSRDLIGTVGLHGPLAGLLHFGAVWVTELVALPRLGLTPPIGGWSRPVSGSTLSTAPCTGATSVASVLLGA